jgi:hypothetical protein
MAVEYNGVNDAVRQALDIPSLRNTTGGSMMCWFNLFSLPPAAPDPSDKYCLVASSVGPPPGVTNTSRLEIEIETDPGPESHFNIVARSLDGSGGGIISSPDGGIVPGTKSHVAITVDYVLGVGRIYQNGQLLTEQVVPGAWGTPTSDTNGMVGSIGTEDSGTPEFVHGLLEDVRIYNRVLTADEIMTIYNCQGVDGIVRGLQQRYEFQDRSNGSVMGQGQAFDSARQQLNASQLTGSPTFRESIFPTYRRRLP